jgi:hypothetical protein
MNEVKLFWSVYESHPEFHNLTDEEKYKLEMESWARKAINMPTVFEERYGESFMRQALGDELYDRYREIRSKVLGLLPREIFAVKEVMDGKSAIQSGNKTD